MQRWMKGTLAAGLALAMAVAAVGAAGADPMAGARPAMLTLLADAAEVRDGADGQTVVLTGVHPVVALTGELGPGRVFDAFEIADFAAHWNTCNDLKDAHDLWHADGLNAMILFEEGAHPHDGLRVASPLFTAPDRHDAARQHAGRAGAARLLLDDAAGAGDTLSFRVRDGQMAPGDYAGVMLLTECLM